MPRPKGRKKTKTLASAKYKSFKPIGKAKVAKCKKSLTRKCESEFMKKALSQIYKREGFEGKNEDRFGPDQIREAFVIAARLRKGSKFSPALKRYVAAQTKKTGPRKKTGPKRKKSTRK